MKNHNIKLILIYTVISILLLVVIIVQLYPLIIEVINNVDDETKTVAYIDNHGAKGIPMLMSLAALQNILAFVPAAAIGFLAGLCYGSFWGPVIFLFGSALGCSYIFISIRQLRGLITPHIKHNSKHNSWLSIDRLDKMKRSWLVVFLCFLIPVLPGSAIIYVFAKSKISPVKFILASTAGNTPLAFIYAFLGDHLSSSNYSYLIITLIILLVVIIILFIFKNKIIDVIVKQGEA